MKKRLLSLFISVTVFLSLMLINVSAADVSYNTIIDENFDSATKASLSAKWDLEDAANFDTDTFKIDNGVLHMSWFYGRYLKTISVVEKPIISTDIKTLLGGGISANSAIGIRQLTVAQKGHNAIYEPDGGNYDVVTPTTNLDGQTGTRIGSLGLFFNIDNNTNSLIMIVKTGELAMNAGNTGYDGSLVRHIEYSVALPQGKIFTDYQNIRIEDKGSSVDVYLCDTYVGKIELSNLVDGMYKTAKIFDAVGVEKVSATNANVPSIGTVSISERDASIDINNITIKNIVDSNNTNPTVDKVIIPISFDLGGTAKQPIELKADATIGQSFTVNEQFNTVSLSVCTWNTSKAGYTFELRKASPTGELVYRHAYSNAVDGSGPLYVVGNLPAGTYYLEINKLVLGTEADTTKVSQVGVWASQNDTDTYAGGSAYSDGKAVNYDVSFSVLSLVANSTAVGNEYVAVDNPGTADLGAVQIVLMAVASVAVAFKKKK